MKITYFSTLVIINFCFYTNVIFATEKVKMQSVVLPQFEQYKTIKKNFKKAKSIDLSSYQDAKLFKTVLTNGFKKNVNFAGHFIVVEHGCGTMCQQYWIIDAIDGKIKDKFQTSIGAKFKEDSDLLVLNPISDSIKQDMKHINEESDNIPFWKDEKIVYLLWNGEKFKIIKELDLYNYFNQNITNKAKENVGLSASSNAFNFDNKLNYVYQKQLVNHIQVGLLNIIMEKTTLNDIKNRFGGEIQHSGDAGDSVYSLCYKQTSNNDKENIIWFISNSEMGGGEHTLTGFAIEPATENNSLKKCSSIVASLEDIVLNIPNINDNLKDIEHHFKELKIGKNKKFIFYSEYPYKKDKNFTTVQSISYTLINNIIVKLGITQITSN